MTTRLHRRFNILLCIPLLSIPLIVNVPAGDLDDLLAPSRKETSLVDQNPTEEWNGVVDAFRRNDLTKARELGNAFLKANYKTSPYQLLGVQVMLNLANADNPSVTRDAGLTSDMKRLMSDRDALRAKYADLQKIVRDSEAVINKLTNQRRQAVQAGTAAYRECARAAEQAQLATAEMEAMKPEIEANKDKVGTLEVGANQNLKNDTMKLLDMLIEADEIEAAFAIANVYIRVTGSDLDVAKKQQNVIRLREDRIKADKIVAAITAEIEPILSQNKGEEAQTRLQTLSAKVESSDQSDSVKTLVIAKLKVLAIRVADVKRSEKHDRIATAAEMADISVRLEELERKLEAAQQYFGTIIRSIDGFSEFSGNLKAKSDHDRAFASIKEKVKSGAVSKEKVENLIKARSEHTGILREVEILQAQSSSLTVVQRGRLGNLHVTAQTALDLLNQATQ